MQKKKFKKGSIGTGKTRVQDYKIHQTTTGNPDQLVR
jgi:hypothetical protein